MKHQMDVSVDFDVDYEVTSTRRRGYGDEPPSGPEFDVTGCTMRLEGGTWIHVVYELLPESVRESIEEAIVEEIDAGA